MRCLATSTMTGSTSSNWDIYLEPAFFAPSFSRTPAHVGLSLLPSSPSHPLATPTTHLAIDVLVTPVPTILAEWPPKKCGCRSTLSFECKDYKVCHARYFQYLRPLSHPQTYSIPHVSPSLSYWPPWRPWSFTTSFLFCHTSLPSSFSCNPTALQAHSRASGPVCISVLLPQADSHCFITTPVVSFVKPITSLCLMYGPDNF